MKKNGMDRKIGGGYEQQHSISTILYFKLLLPKLATVISPKLNVMINYKVKTGRWPNLKNPKCFTEKMCWLKLNNYNHNSLVKACADKYKVRDFVSERLGDEAKDILNPLQAVYDRPEQIDWGALPNSFAIKWNFGSGFNYIVHDKSKIDIKYVVNKLQYWGKQRAWLQNAELQYRGVDKILLVEKYLAGKNGALPEDYKVYCFNGRAVGVFVISERESGHLKGAFFDRNWRYVGKPRDIGDSLREYTILPNRPASLEKMISIAEKLSEEFPFVRVDFYEVDGKPIFGEMTFTPAGCIDVHEIDVDGKSMGELLDINKR